MKKHYSIDIKIQAVLKAARPGVLAQEVADEIGIHTFSLYRWKKELRDAGLLNKMPEKIDVQTDLKLQDQLERVQKENWQLKMENAVLKNYRSWATPKERSL